MFEINSLAGISAEQSIAMAQDVKFPSLVQTWIPDIMNRSNISIDKSLEVLYITLMVQIIQLINKWLQIGKHYGFILSIP